MVDSTLFLPTGSSSIRCKLQPVVLFNVLDHYIRRNEDQDRVIGTLLGITNDFGVVEIRNSFAVRHFEKDQVGLLADFLNSVLKLHLRANPKEVIVGWYTTGTEIHNSITTKSNDIFFNEFFSKESQHTPIHLTVDISLLGTGMGIKAFIISPLSLPSAEKPLVAQFQPVKLNIETFDAEKTAVEVLMQAKAESSNQTTALSELGNVEASITQISKMLDSLTEYVDKIVAGEIPHNSKIGRFLSSTVSSLTKIDPQVFDKMFNNSMQDLLMVVYLTNLTRTQLALTEKLQNLS